MARLEPARRVPPRRHRPRRAQERPGRPSRGVAQRRPLPRGFEPGTAALARAVPIVPSPACIVLFVLVLVLLCVLATARRRWRLLGVQLARPPRQLREHRDERRASVRVRVRALEGVELRAHRREAPSGVGEALGGPGCGGGGAGAARRLRGGGVVGEAPRDGVAEGPDEGAVESRAEPRGAPRRVRELLRVELVRVDPRRGLDRVREPARRRGRRGWLRRGPTAAGGVANVAVRCVRRRRAVVHAEAELAAGVQDARELARLDVAGVARDQGRGGVEEGGDTRVAEARRPSGARARRPSAVPQFTTLNSPTDAPTSASTSDASEHRARPRLSSTWRWLIVAGSASPEPNPLRERHRTRGTRARGGRHAPPPPPTMRGRRAKTNAPGGGGFFHRCSSIERRLVAARSAARQ